VTYVKADAGGNNDGTSWENAFVYLQDALAVVEAGDEIWVAAGVYRPDQGENQTPGDRNSRFDITRSVSLYGGFDGTEETLDERAGLFEQTVLSGDLNDDDEPNFVNVDDNSRNVVWVWSAAGGVIVDGFRIRGANATELGGGLWIRTPCAVRNCMFDGNRTNDEGGAVAVGHLDAGDVSFEACSFTGNQAGAGGAVAVDHVDVGDVNFEACSFAGNEAGWGGALYSCDTAGLTLVDCDLVGNVAALRGGALYLYSVLGSSLENGASPNNAAYATGTRWAGPHPALIDCTFAQNTALFGGGVYVFDGSEPWELVTLNNCTFAQNTAQLGGGLCVRRGLDSLALATLSNCTFTENTAQVGGRLQPTEDILLERCSFVENAVTNIIPNEYARGGGAYIVGGSVSLCDCIFSRNVAEAPAGADGGGLYSLYTQSPHVRATRCTFEENSASDYGGAINYGSHGSPLFVNCVFRRNAARCGGVIHGDMVLATVAQCLLVGNSAAEDGGAVHSSFIGFLYFNCVMHENVAGGRGGGMFHTYGGPTVCNSILWNNQDQDGAGESSQIFGQAPRVAFSCIQGWTGQIEGIATFGDDPLFVDPLGPDGIPGTEDDDLHLSAGSPCIDRGTNWLVPEDWGDLDGDGDVEEFLPLDLDGDGRFFDDPNTPDNSCGAAIVDLGPYEVGGTGPQPCRGDADGDGDVDWEDLSCLLSSYGTDHTDPAYNSVCDFDGWGQVDLDDLAMLLALYGRQCP